MPQTKFVVKKHYLWDTDQSLFVNKIDKPAAEPDRVVDEVYLTFLQTWMQLKTIRVPSYLCSGKRWLCKIEANDGNMDLKPLFETILKKKFQNQKVLMKMDYNYKFTLDYDNFIGKIGI